MDGPRNSESAAQIRTERVRRAIEDALGGQRYAMWFQETTRLTVEGSTLRIDASSPFVADWIGRNFGTAIRAATAAELGAEAGVEVRCQPVPQERPAGTACPPHSGPRQGSRGPAGDGVVGRRPTGALPAAPARHAARPSFEGFLVGTSNRLAFEAARRMAAGDAAAPPLLFLHGSCGVGKTHLLHAIVKARRESAPASRVRMATAEEFVNRYIRAVREGSLPALRSQLRACELLVLDDVQFLSGKSGSQQEFLHTLDGVLAAGGRVAIASDAPPREIASLTQSLSSRFLSGLVLEIGLPDEALRRALARRLSAAQGLRLTDEAVERLAASALGGIRELQGAVHRLAAEQLASGSPAPLDEVAVTRTLRDGDASPRALRPDALVDATCALLGADPAAVRGSSKARAVVQARDCSAALLRDEAGLAWPEIARRLGRASHSSVIAGAARARRATAVGRLDDGSPAAFEEIRARVVRRCRQGALRT